MTTEPGILDAHQHLWKFIPSDFDWISRDMSVIRRDFMELDLFRELKENKVNGSIAVQGRPSETETSFLVDLADRNDFIKGVVGWVDLCSPYLPGRLAFYKDCPKLKGFRHVVQDEPDDRFLLREDFCRGISQLAAYGFSYDLLIRPSQLQAALELVEKFPNQRFVIDHLAKPLIKDHTLEPWATLIRRIAQQPNVYCKLSGLVTEADWAAWTAADFQPYLDIVLEAFGAQRLMFGSDWPVCLLAAEYQQVLALVAQYISPLSKAEQSAILGSNAATFYRV